MFGPLVIGTIVMLAIVTLVAIGLHSLSESGKRSASPITEAKAPNQDAIEHDPVEKRSREER